MYFNSGAMQENGKHKEALNQFNNIDEIIANTIRVASRMYLRRNRNPVDIKLNYFQSSSRRVYCLYFCIIRGHTLFR